MSNKIQNIETSIQRTGFIFEYRVSQMFLKKGWKVAPNRYYLDDISGVPREIDLLASKSKFYSGIEIVTNLLISCKKSDLKDFLFLTKSKVEGDPEILSPSWKQFIGHARLKYIVDAENVNVEVLNRLSQLSEYKENFETGYDVFAFQEMAKNNQAPQNQKALFSSVTSLIKALEYEYTKRSVTDNKKVISNFYLISVCDTELYTGLTNDTGITVEKQDYVLYSTQYIINQMEGEYPISFVDVTYLNTVIDRFDIIHNQLCKGYEDGIKSFFIRALSDNTLRSEYMRKFKLNFEKLFYYSITEDDYDFLQTYGHILLIYDGDTKTVIFESAIFNEATIAKFKADERLIKKLKKWLHVNFRFSGEIDFQYAPVDGIDDENYDYENTFDESEFRKQNWQHFRLSR